MKKLFPLLFLVLILCCKSANKIGLSTQNRQVISNEQIVEIIDTLASDYMEGRAFESAGIEKAATFIENFLKSNDIPAFFTEYHDSFNVGARKGYNIIGVIEGNEAKLKKEFIILSAHYDHIGKSVDKNDSVYNGANDNASGVSAVLNIARYLKINKLNKRSIIVAVFSGEEIGLTGSEHFAEKIEPKASEIYCNVNIDMIGSVLTSKPGKVYITGFERSNMGTILNQYLGNDTIANLDNSLIYDVFQLSDNFPLYEKLKIPAHTFCTFDFNNYKYYHKVTDEIKHLDVENTGIIVRNIAFCVAKIASSDTKEIVLSK